ncbi:hypothetical protein [Polymorphobacter megasporae]|uniref:hypothetical protein n=1 Tax=Glacieibacterium megasporae TaxID=2835787 RepID=UPI001CAA7C80|nr:hypothetical protein [Polymorphobacter megasporae]UAJ08756.1 hypothetical protein KTC28_10170 [Polymorphobacter megasporae]
MRCCRKSTKSTRSGGRCAGRNERCFSRRRCFRRIVRGLLRIARGLLRRDRGFLRFELHIERDKGFGISVVSAFGRVVVAVAVAYGIQRLVKAVVGEAAAVEHQEHQQPVVEDRPHADEAAALIDLLLLAIHRALDRNIGDLRHSRGPRCLPRIGERPCARVLAEAVRARCVHARRTTRALDAAGIAETLDENTLAIGGPAVVARAKGGGGEGGRCVFHRRVYVKFTSCRKVVSLASEK